MELLRPGRGGERIEILAHVARRDASKVSLQASAVGEELPHGEGVRPPRVGIANRSVDELVPGELSGGASRRYEGVAFPRFMYQAM
jgi:hypothetical protein